MEQNDQNEIVIVMNYGGEPCKIEIKNDNDSFINKVPDLKPQPVKLNRRKKKANLELEVPIKDDSYYNFNPTVADIKAGLIANDITGECVVHIVRYPKTWGCYSWQKQEDVIKNRKHFINVDVYIA